MIEFVKITMKKCHETNFDIYMSLLQIGSTLISPRLPSPVTLLFNGPSRGKLPRFSRPPIIYNNVEDNPAMPIQRQPHESKHVDICKNTFFNLKNQLQQYNNKMGDCVSFHRIMVGH